MPNLFLEKTIDIQAPAAKVWERLKSECASEWDVGDAISGKGWEGKIMKIEPDKLLKHNVLRMKDGVSALFCVITYELREHNAMTILVARESFAEAQSDKTFAETLAGWDKKLAEIKTAAEG